MKLFRAIQNAADIPGEWFVYAEDDEGKIEFCIKPIPPGEELRIESKYLGRERKFTLTEDGQQLSHNIEKTAAYHAERALHALVDSRGAEITIEDEKSAELYSKALGEKVAVGATVKLDGKWSKDVKEQAFKDALTVAFWISQKAARLRVTAGKEEEGKDVS